MVSHSSLMYVVETTEKKSKEAAARGFSVLPKRVREWFHQRKELSALKKKGKSKQN